MSHNPGPVASSPTPTISVSNKSPPTAHFEDIPQEEQKIGGVRFWLIFLSLCLSTFLSALDLTAVSTTLPAIVEHLQGDQFVWVGSAYALGSTAVLPLVGGLAQVFGRRPVVLGSLAFFAVGSAVSGAATSMNMLVAGRTIQGIGGGGILSMTSVISTDLVPLRKRGTYMGVIGGVWAIASAIGPPLGGAFSQSNWRWLFYMNLPLVALAMTLVFFFLTLKVPQDDFRTKMRKMDWIGNFIVIASTASTVIGLAWAGVQYPWSSYRVLVPLILGILGLVLFFYYEAKFAKEPVVPWSLVNNRTSFLGYVTIFLHGLASTTVFYYLPVYFQAAKEQSPVDSGVSLFGNTFTVAPAAIICGVLVAKLGYYKPQNFFGWMLSSIGVGTLSLLRADSSKAKWVVFQIIEGIGFGFLVTGPTFPIQAPLPVSASAQAMALDTFIRSYSQTWAITIGATILQNELKKRLPAELALSSTEISYSVIPRISSLPEPTRTAVREAFAESLSVIWKAMVGFCALGAILVLGMKEVKMHEVTDENWGMAERETPGIGENTAANSGDEKA